ncbi:MAG: hypothetical protein IPM39_23530 [Chloroflexi bacterium]|nr:hypothetical protein [Chloroflexota bacterium]
MTITVISRFDLVRSAVSLVIPRLIAQEVTRNLTQTEYIKGFYRLFSSPTFAFVVEEPVPSPLVLKYTTLGLPAKADAFIGAFAEWMGVGYLVSDNRHFLRELKTDAYQVTTPGEFLALRR